MKAKITFTKAELEKLLREELEGRFSDAFQITSLNFSSYDSSTAAVLELTDQSPDAEDSN